MTPVPHFTDLELAAYISESLSVTRAVEVEQAIRQSDVLRQRIAQLIAQSDEGRSSVGDCWRRRLVSCPQRSTWAAYLEGQIHGELAEYLRFHLEEIGCRCCTANVEDLRNRGDAESQSRVRKFFQTSVGRLQQLPSDDAGAL